MSVAFRALSIFVLPFSLLTHASESPQVFIGAKGGYQWASDDAYNHSEPHGSMIGIFGGLQLSPEWSWDLGYQNHDDLEAHATSVNVKTWLMESALRYDWYLQDSVSLYGRLGIAYWDVEKQVLSSEKLTANGFSPLGEVGVNYHVTPDLNLSAGYQYIYGIGSSNTGEYDSHGVMIGLSYTFGNSQVKAVESAAPASEETALVEPSPQVQTFSPKRFDITFSSDVATLSNEATEQLSQASAILAHYSQSQAVVVGHTDATGSEAHNQALSEARAQTVANQLVESGVDSEQVEWRGEGETNPIADNRTSQGRAENRRVEVLIPSFQFQE